MEFSPFTQIALEVLLVVCVLALTLGISTACVWLTLGMLESLKGESE